MRHSHNRIAVYRKDSPNTGDLHSSPGEYFSSLRITHSIDVLDLPAFLSDPSRYGVRGQLSAFDVYFVGGGGLLGNRFFEEALSTLEAIPGKKILWGAGFNSEISRASCYDHIADTDQLRMFDLIGLRDANTAFEWVPCPSCMHPAFHDLTPCSHGEMLLYLHHDSAFFDNSLHCLPPNAPTMTNTDNVRTTLSALASYDLVLTNSYHGAYWATLLGKRVIAFPSSSKFFRFRHGVALSSTTAWERSLGAATVHPHALSECRAANESFLASVELFLQNETRKSLRLYPTMKQRRSRKISNAAKAQAKLLSILCCPVTRGPVSVCPITVSCDAIKEGVIVSNRLAKPVGHIRNFQIDFVRVDEGTDHNTIKRELQSGNLPAVETAVPKVIRLQPLDERLTRTGSWTLLESENLLVGENEGSEVSCVIAGTSCGLLLCKHPWSGIAEIFVNDVPFAQVDLYNPHTTIPLTLSVESSSAPFTLRVRVTGSKAPISMGHQVLLRGIEQQSTRMTRPQYEKVPHVRGAAFTQAFHECFLRVPESGLALDIGGGNRQIDDDRYINLDYAAYTEPDICADALRLPFRDNSIDFIYSSGVFEHLKDPLAAGNEAFRVLKPGGSILVGMSFMQPIHSEGQHFFNATPWGIREIFKQFDIADVYWEGSLSFLFDWILTASGVAEKATEKHLKTIRDTVALYEQAVSYDKLMYIANGVWLKGSKPLPQ